MARMRSVLFALPLACIVLAEDSFPQRLRAFERARGKTLEPGAHAKVNPAVEDLIATGDVRAVTPLLKYLVETFVFETYLFEQSKQIQKKGAAAFDRMRDIDRELTFLRLKEKAGDETVGPEIERRLDGRRKQKQIFERMQQETTRATRAINFVRRLRDKVVEGSASILRGLSGPQADAGLVAARRALDVAKREQALYLVIVLRDSQLPQAEGHLLDVIAHPKADAAVLRAAQFALSRNMTRKGAEVLVRLWEQDPKGSGESARHVLSLVARKKLESVQEARAWAATLK